MGKKDIDFETLEKAWDFYLEDQSPQSIKSKCAALGAVVHANTISRWINQGVKRKGVLAFKDRLKKIRAAAVAASLPSGMTQVEIVSPQTASEIHDDMTIKFATVQLEQWRGHMDQQLLHATIANDLVLECLMGVDPADAGAVKNAMTAWKNAVSAQRGIVESHAVIRGMAPRDGDGDVRDEWVSENFDGWTAEEHRAFRDHGIWPEGHGPPPDFIVSPRPEPEGDNADNTGELDVYDD